MSIPMDEFLKALERIDRLNAERVKSKSNSNTSSSNTEPTPGTSSKNVNNCSHPQGDGTLIHARHEDGFEYGPISTNPGHGDGSWEAGDGDQNCGRKNEHEGETKTLTESRAFASHGKGIGQRARANRNYFSVRFNNQNQEPDSHANSNPMPGYSENYDQMTERARFPPTSGSGNISTPAHIPHYPQTFTAFEVPLPHTLNQYILSHSAWNAMGQTVPDTEIGAIVSPFGYISVRCCPEIKVDIMPSRTLRVQHNGLRIIVATQANSEMSCIVHPVCTLYQYGKNVEARIAKNFDAEIANYVRMWRKGISFTYDGCGLTYLVDHVGVRSNRTTFSDLSGDVSYPIFYEAEHYMNPSTVKASMDILRSGSFWISPNNGVRIWKFPGLNISYGNDGILKIDRDDSETIQISPNNTLHLNTPLLHCSIEQDGGSEKVIAKQDEKCFHWNGSCLKVECGIYCAGLDPWKKLKIF